MVDSTNLYLSPSPSTEFGAMGTSGYVAGESENATGSNLLTIAWRSRWLILLCVVLGGGAAWGYLQRAVPYYTSTSQIYVEQTLPQLLSNNSSWGRFSDSYLYTQAELIRSNPVLSAAVETLEPAGLSSFRESQNPLAVVRQNLSVSVHSQSDIINVSVTLPDAEDAAQVVNAVVQAYITLYAERRKSSVAEVLKILRSEKAQRDEELEERRKALVEFRKNHAKLAVQAGEDDAVTQLFSTLTSELNASQIQLLEAKTLYERAKKMLQNPDQLPFLLELARSAHSVQDGSELTGQIQRVEQTLVAQRAQWGEGYPSVKLQQESLERLRQRQQEQQKSMVRAYVDTLRQNYELLTQRRDELQRAYDKQFELAMEVSSQAAELAALKDKYQRTARTCDILDGRIQEMNLNEEAGSMNMVSILNVAGTGQQTSPDRPKALSMGLAFGALLGFGLAWLRDFLDHRIKSVDEFASVLRLPVIGAVPLISGSRGQAGQLVIHQPRSAVAEAIRTLRTALQLGVAGPETKIFGITSPASGDGKSTVASNLALTMAQSGQRVLLIDADMRKPTLHQVFGIQAEVGLAAVLEGTQPAIEAVIPSGVNSLDLLPCGVPPANPVELLSSDLFAEALSQLASHYDRILIDAPPVLPVADARLIAAAVDCMLLVLRAERSTRRLSLAARDELLKVRTPRVAVIVNALPQAAYGYGGDSPYGSSYGHSAYTYGDAYGEAVAPPQRRLRGTSAGPVGEVVTVVDR